MMGYFGCTKQGIFRTLEVSARTNEVCDFTVLDLLFHQYGAHHLVAL